MDHGQGSRRLGTASAVVLHRNSCEGQPVLKQWRSRKALDTRSPDQRSRIMQAVKSKDTTPEMRVRRLLHKLGYRFRLHRRDLPGCPDIVLPRLRKAIFVHGCFWHAHGCAKGQPPKSRQDYWLPKLEANVKRDGAKIEQLKQLGWQVLVVWQCETKDIDRLTHRLQAFVDES